jgi:hypothetical protein
MSKRKWRYLKPNGEQYGPVTSADLRAAAQLGFVTPEDLVQLSGTHDWIKAGLIEGLFGPSQDSLSPTHSARFIEGDHTAIEADPAE